MDHELFVVLGTFFGSDVFFVGAFGEDFVLKAAFGSDDPGTLGVFREEFFTGFEVCGSGFLFAALEHLAESFHGGLKFRFFEFRLLALDGSHESLDEGFSFKIGGSDAELAELLGETTAGAETEGV